MSLALVGCGDSGPSQTVTIRLLDTMRYDPERVEVRAGEEVQFVLENPGNLPHEFVLATEEVQREHELVHGGRGSHQGQEPIADVLVNPGNKKTVTLRFDKPGELVIGCHVVGHWSSGMRALLSVK